MPNWHGAVAVVLAIGVAVALVAAVLKAHWPGLLMAGLLALIGGILTAMWGPSQSPSPGPGPTRTPRTEKGPRRGPIPCVTSSRPAGAACPRPGSRLLSG